MTREEIKLALKFQPHVKQVWVIGKEYWLVPKEGAELIDLTKVEVKAEVKAETKTEVKAVEVKEAEIKSKKSKK